MQQGPVKQAGIKMLPNVPTWDEFAAAAKAIRAQDKDIYGFNMVEYDLGYCYEKSLPIADGKGNFVPVNGTPNIQAVQWLVDLYKQCGTPSVLQFDPMTTGKLGMSIQMVGTVFGYQPKATFDVIGYVVSDEGQTIPSKYPRSCRASTAASGPGS